MSAHVLPIRGYMAVFVGLMGLTALTTWIAYRDLGPLNDLVAMSIAVTKALLVVLYFMHVRYSSRLIWVFAGAAVVWLLILFGLTLGDYETRALVPGWEG